MSSGGSKMRQRENARERVPMRRRPYPDCRKLAKADFFTALVCALLVCLHVQWLAAQGQKVAWSAQEQGIVAQLRDLRRLPDEQRAHVTTDLARAIRQLPASPNRLILANGLANLSTEGDFGHDTLQEVATTLAAALRETPPAEDKGQPAAPFVELAQLVRYEHVHASLDSPQFTAAMAKLDADD